MQFLSLSTGYHGCYPMACFRKAQFSLSFGSLAGPGFWAQPVIGIAHVESDRASWSGSAGQKDDDSCGNQTLIFSSAISVGPCVALYRPHNCLCSSFFFLPSFLSLHMLVMYTQAGGD